MLQTIYRPDVHSGHTMGPTILGLPSCATLGIVELNCAVNLQKRKLVQQKKPTTEGRTVRQDLQHLNSPPLNTKEDLIKAYPDRFKGIGHFPGTYHITLHSDAKPTIHASRKCLITIQPLVQEKLDEFLEQGIIAPVEEPMDWVSTARLPLLKRLHIYWQEARSLPR